MTSTGDTRGWPIRQIFFAVLMLALTGLFIGLGTWQVQRLAEKNALIALVEERFEAAPSAFPPADQWPSLSADDMDYSPFTLEGRFLGTETVLVFTNLPDPVGPYGGVGYWVLTPFEQETGGIVWVNRGFVPEAMAPDYIGESMAPAGPATIEGVARRPERAGTFTPASDFPARREWIRDPERLSGFLSADFGPVAPVTIDQVAGAPGELPQGGETLVTFSNRHLEYAGTWYLFAIITPIMLAVWLWRQRHPGNIAQRNGDH